MQQSEIEIKDITIQKLTTENDSFKNNKELIKRDNLIKKQKSKIKNLEKENNTLSDLVNILENNIETLKNKFNKEVEKWKKLFNKMCNALDKVLGRKPKEYVEDYEDLADSINNDYYDYEKNKEKEKNDYEIGM